MCLGVPGKLLHWLDRDPVFGRGLVEFGGIQRECQMACVPEAEPGDYVVVHAGLAICLINEAEAKQTLLDLEMIGAAQEETVAPE
ncbi:MAG: HypC/HybG/HupF family hydrogenase formation chaperone [Planctomycetia bacterium]